MPRGTPETPFVIHVEGKTESASKGTGVWSSFILALSGALVGAAITAALFLAGIVGENTTAERSRVPELRLVDFLRSTKQELFNAQLPTLNDGEAPAFKFKGFDLELTVVAKTEKTASGKVETTLFAVGSDFKGSTETTHKLVVHLDPVPEVTVSETARTRANRLLLENPPDKRREEKRRAR